MKESQFRKFLCGQIKTLGGHASKVESHDLSAGIPDVDYCLESVENHIELKVGSKEVWPEIRPTQCLWFNKRIKAGGKPFIMLLDNDTGMVHVIAGTCVDRISNKPIGVWIEHADASILLEEIHGDWLLGILCNRVAAPWPWPGEPEASDDD